MQPRHLESRPIDSLHPAKRNPRTHSRKQVRQIADSIERFGFTNPVLIDDDDGSSPATGGWRRPGCSA